MWRELRSASLGACVAVVLALGVQGFTAAPQAQGPDTLKELLVEVRGLRAAMEQLASAGPRVQLMFGRLQLQEQRINEQVRKLDTVRGQLSKAQTAENEQRAAIQRVEDFVRTHPGAPEEQDLANMRKHLLALSAETQKVLVEESALTSMIATEQNRWTDINRLLDDLDRSLSRR